MVHQDDFSDSFLFYFRGFNVFLIFFNRLYIKRNSQIMSLGKLISQILRMISDRIIGTDLICCIQKLPRSWKSKNRNGGLNRILISTEIVEYFAKVGHAWVNFCECLSGLVQLESVKYWYRLSESTIVGMSHFWEWILN